MSHEYLIRQHFAAAVNKIPKHQWQAIPNYAAFIKGAGGDAQGGSPNGKPDGEVKSRGRYFGVEFKGGEETNGLWSFQGWRENQRRCAKVQFEELESDYYLCVGFWEGKFRITHCTIYMLPHHVWLDIEKWVMEGTGLHTVAGLEDNTIGSRKGFSVESYLENDHRHFPQIAWKDKGLEIKELWNDNH